MITILTRLILLSTISLLAVSLAAMHHEKALTGAQIIDKYVEKQEVYSELDYIKMSIISPGPSVVERRVLAVYRKNPDGGRSYLIRIVRPAEVQGVTLLAVENKMKEIDQYLYLPDVGEARRLRGKSQSGSFLGSDFTFQDLLRETPSNFRYERLEDVFINGVECYSVKARSNSQEEGNTYQYRNMYIEKEEYDLLKIDYYGQSDELLKTFSAFDYHSPQIKGITTRPRRAVMENKSKNSITVFTVIEGRIDQEIPDNLFTPKKITTWTADEVEEFIYDNGFVVNPQNCQGGKRRVFLGNRPLFKRLNFVPFHSCLWFLSRIRNIAGMNFNKTNSRIVSYNNIYQNYGNRH